MRGGLKRKTLVFGAVILLLLTVLLPVYAEITCDKSKVVESKTSETTNVDIENPLDNKSFLDRYGSSEIVESHGNHPYFNRHNQHNKIRKPTVIDGEEWDIIVPDDYPTIQKAVDNADMGFWIYVKSGVYKENIQIDGVSSITLHGENKESTIIDASYCNDVIRIEGSATGINISGFTIKNSGEDFAGINVSSHYNIIKDNIFIDNDHGIKLHSSSGNQILENEIKDNGEDGILLHRSYANNISGNTIADNECNGIEFTYSSLGSVLDNNKISGHNECGVYLDESSLGNMFTRCTIEGNNYGVLCAGVSDGNIFQQNAFLENTVHAFDSSLDQWDYQGLGNFWDDYKGIDSNGDGIGDTPHGIDGGDNIDRYPLMNQVMIYEECEGFITENTHMDYSTVSSGNSNSEGEDIIVPDDYPTIQEAVDQANPGDNIYVRSGIYHETVNISTPELTIHGGNKENTIIDGGGNGHVVFVNKDADGLSISGFTIQSSGNHFTGLYLYSDSTVIEDIIFNDCNIGVALRDNTENVITDCEFENNNFGIWTWMCTSTLFEDNVIEYNSLDGIALQWSNSINVSRNVIRNNSFNGILEISCSELDIQYNQVRSNKEFGIQIFSSNENTIKKNRVEKNTNDGISFHKSNKNVLINNNITNNSYDGVSFRFFSSDNYSYSNIIANNYVYGILLRDSSKKNIVMENKIINNGFGIYLYFSSNNNTISENSITQNELDGINLYFSSNNTMSGNTITDNEWYGIAIVDSLDNIILGNTITDNLLAGIHSIRSQNNLIKENNFIDNNEKFKNIHYIGEYSYKDIFLRNYWSPRLIQLPVPYLVQINMKLFDSPFPHVRFTTDWDLFPKAIPYQYSHGG